MSRVPPGNPDAERSVLGCILVDWNTMKDVADILDPADFFAPMNQNAFFVMQALWHDGVRPDAHTVLDKAQSMGVEISADNLLEAMKSPPSLSNARRYAEIVVRNSRARRLIGLLSGLVEEAFEPGADPDAIIARAGEVAFDRIAAARDRDASDLWVFKEFMDMADDIVENTPWVIPGMMRQKWRAMLVAEEGVGKFTFFMQIALLISNGYDPFDLSRRIEPQRVLIVNAENPTEVIQHQARLVESKTMFDLSTGADRNLHIWHKEGGVDLLTRTDQGALERVLSEVRPNLIVAGPLYKLFQVGERTMEQDTKAMITYLDDIRVRYSTALLLEHHAPKGASMTARELFPGGSSLLMRWPEMGLSMKVVDRSAKRDAYEVELERFRGDRLPADWPDVLIRGGVGNRLPWLAAWRQSRQSAAPAAGKGGGPAADGAPLEVPRTVTARASA